MEFTGLSKRRLKRMVFPLETIADLGRVGTPGHWSRTTHGVPADAKFVRAWIDPEADALVVVYEHPSFEEQYAGSHQPEVRRLWSVFIEPSVFVEPSFPK